MFIRINGVWIKLYPDSQLLDSKEKGRQPESANAASVDDPWVRAFEHLRIHPDGQLIVCESSTHEVDAEEDVPTFFEVDKVRQCLVFFLSSLIQLGGPPQE